MNLEILTNETTELLEKINWSYLPILTQKNIQLRYAFQLKNVSKNTQLY